MADKSPLDPLHWATPIVDNAGRPTQEFMRKWGAQRAINDSVPDVSTAAAVSAILDKISAAAHSILVRGTTQWAGWTPTASSLIVADAMGVISSLVLPNDNTKFLDGTGTFVTLPPVTGFLPLTGGTLSGSLEIDSTLSLGHAPIAFTFTPNFQVDGTTAATSGGAFYRASADGNPPSLIMAKSRGTLASPAACASNDQGWNLLSEFYDGSNFVVGAIIRTVLAAAPSANVVPSNMRFYTMDAGGTLAERLRVTETGNVLASNALRVGTLTDPMNASDGDLTVDGRLVLGNTATGGLQSMTTYDPSAITGGSVVHNWQTVGNANVSGSANIIHLNYGLQLTGANNALHGVANQSAVLWDSTGTLTDATGGFFNVRSRGTSAGTITDARAIRTQLQVSNAGVITGGEGALIDSPSVAGTGTLGTIAGVRINAQKVTGVTLGYGIWQRGTSDINVFASPMAIGTDAAPTASAVLDLNSTTGAFLPPRMTTTQKNALTPTAGMIVQDTTLGKLQQYQGSAWVDIGTGSGSGGGNYTLLETLTPSSAASVTSESWAGGGYSSVVFDIELTMSADGSNIQVQFKLNGAYKNTANYRYAISELSSSGSTSSDTAQTGTSATISGIGATWGIGNATLEDFAGQMRIFYPDGTTKPKHGIVEAQYGAPSGAFVYGRGAFGYDGTDAASALTGVKFLASSGTFTGTIKVYGVK